MCWSLAIHEAATTSGYPDRSYGCITLPREIAHSDTASVIVRTTSRRALISVRLRMNPNGKATSSQGMSSWRRSWCGGTVIRLCARVCIQDIFAQIFSGTCPGGKTLYSCVPSLFCGRYSLMLHSIGQCTRRLMERLHSFTYCTASPSAVDDGKFFIPWARPGEPSKAALDPQLGEILAGG
jgi:hypothetical protein